MIRPQPRRSFVCVVLSLVLAISVPVFGVARAPELPDPGNPSMTRDQQKQLGLQAAAEIYKQMPVLPDSSVETKYIRSLGERLVATIPPDRSWPFEFHVVAQKEINAFALPGGPMFVNVGTITAADNEAELAGVMAHEMAHVYMQHSAKQQQKNSLLGGLAGLAGALAGMGGGAWGSLAQAGIQFGAGTLMLKYSRGDEAQADAVGAIILWKAGYNPVALADFFQTIEKQSGGSGPQFLSDHPDPGNRRTAIENEIRDWPAKHYSGNSAEFAKVHKDAATVPVYTAQEIADGAKTGRWAAENRKNGAVFAGAPSDNVSVGVPAVPYSQIEPSEEMRTANFGVIAIDRPVNWQVSGNGQSATIAPSAGASNAGVAYGVVIRSEQAPSTNMKATQLASAIIQSLRSGDPNMKQVGDAEPLTVDGNTAASAELETISPMADQDGNSQRERDWLVVVPRGRTAMFLVFVSTLSDYDRLRPTFEKMLHSIQF
ncbi:MAG TPA: M48 family metallopeptidase [Candidatus Acidoferrales bacterium]|nr:M48 family metallopeptidase [Candidatus Acidoferrales bacterium]